MKQYFVVIYLVFGLTLSAFSEIPERPNPPRLVNDFAEVLSLDERQQLESELVQFARETSTQIVVVTIADLDDYDPGDYSFRLGEKWGVGQKGKDNGIVILLKPKQGNNKGQIFVATGYGLEGVLPDAIVNGTVIDNEMIPQFEQNDYFGGLKSGINVIMNITRGEYTAEEYQEYYANNNGGIVPGIFFFFFIFIIISIARRRRGHIYSPGRSLPFWLALGMMSGRGSSRGAFGNFSSGGGNFGGFGGFGGGSFGGGGAGGSW